jgi:polysaccharide export outer membrane protein
MLLAIQRCNCIRTKDPTITNAEPDSSSCSDEPEYDRVIRRKSAFCDLRSGAQRLATGLGLLVGVGGLGLAGGTGCASSQAEYAQFLRSYEQVVSTGDYRVAPPDALAVAAPVSPEIDGTAVRIRPDGKIALRLLGEVYVAGLTTQEIAEKLETLLARYYVEPEVVVNVARYASQHVYVFGEVTRPGAQPYTGRDSLTQAIARAMPNNFAWQERVRVTRPSADEGERTSVVVNVRDIIEGGDLTRDFLLQPGDIIQVPPTPIAWVGHQVRALLYPVTPVLDAYETPADFLEARDTYRNHGDDDDDDRGRLDGLLR